jgi:hypothetical protein
MHHRVYIPSAPGPCGTKQSEEQKQPAIKLSQPLLKTIHLTFFSVIPKSVSKNLFQKQALLK